MTEGNTLPQWLSWAREIQALAQTGQTYALNHWQRERYQRLMEIAAEIVGTQANLPVESILESFKAQPGYATLKVDVRGAVFRNGKLLLVREKMDGGWTMPGGWADVGDAPAAGAEREVWEESGFRVQATKLVGVYDANRIEPMQLYHAVKLVFLCEIIGGEATPSSETTEVAFFAEDQIPTPLSEERTRARHIGHAFAAQSDPNWITVFD